MVFALLWNIQTFESRGPAKLYLKKEIFKYMVPAIFKESYHFLKSNTVGMNATYQFNLICKLIRVGVWSISLDVWLWGAVILQSKMSIRYGLERNNPIIKHSYWGFERHHRFNNWWKKTRFLRRDLKPFNQVSHSVQASFILIYLRNAFSFSSSVHRVSSQSLLE